MDWWILGGAVPPGSPSGSARPQRSKHQKTENERHAPCTRTSCPDTEHPARVLRVIHSAFSLLPRPSPLPRTLLLGYILKWFLFSICIAPSWSVTSLPHLGCSNMFPPGSSASSFPLPLSTSTQQPEGFYKSGLITCISPCLKTPSGFPLHLEWNPDSFPWPTRPHLLNSLASVSPTSPCALVCNTSSTTLLFFLLPGSSSFFRFQRKWYLLIDMGHFRSMTPKHPFPHVSETDMSADH